MLIFFIVNKFIAKIFFSCSGRSHHPLMGMVKSGEISIQRCCPSCSHLQCSRMRFFDGPRPHITTCIQWSETIINKSLVWYISINLTNIIKIKFHYVKNIKIPLGSVSTAPSTSSMVQQWTWGKAHPQGEARNSDKVISLLASYLQCLNYTYN